MRTLILAASLAMAACDTAVHVDVTADVGARFSSVLVTVEEIWFNENPEAVPADETWQKFELDEAVTLDLVRITGGAIARIASKLEVPEATYRQIRLILASRDGRLHDSADDLDADYNNQVIWFDEDGDAHTLPLEVLNAAQGVGIAMELKVEEGRVGGSTVRLVFDATRDLTQFSYGSRTGFLLNPSLRAFDVEEVGTIRGALSLPLSEFQTATGRPEVQVTAQKLDEQLRRHVVVGSASVGRNGSFVLYPLPMDEDERTTRYDLVISGPRIQTIVIREVPVTEGPPASTAPLALGVLAPEPASSFEADVVDTDPVVPRGAQVGFYQTLPGEDEPHLIALAAIDPLLGRFAEPVVLSRAGSISYATFGTNFTFRTGVPEEGASRYSVAALSPHHGHGPFAPTALRPASRASDTATFSVPAPGIPSGAVPGTASATVTVETPGKYDRGALLVTHEGSVVTVAALDEVLQQLVGTTFVDVPQVPAGTGTVALPRGLYHLEAWTWNSADPRNTFQRHPGAAAIDLRAGENAATSVTIR